MSKSNEDLNINENIADASKRFKGIQRPLQFQKAKRILRMKQMLVEKERGLNPQVSTVNTSLLDSQTLVKRSTTSSFLHKRARTKEGRPPGDAFEFA